MKKLKYWFPSVLIMILIFIGSNDPVSGEKSDFITRFIWKTFTFITGIISSPEQEASTTFVIRKLAHITEYLLLTVSFLYAIAKSINVSVYPSIYLLAFLLAFFYAISDEYHQTLIPGRVGTYEDVMIDSVGILIAFLLFRFKNNGQKCRK